MPIQTTEELLYLVLAVAVGVLTIALVWLLVEAAICFHRANRLVRELRERVARFEESVRGIRDRIEHSAGYLHLLAEGAKQLLHFFMEDRGGKKKK